MKAALFKGPNTIVTDDVPVPHIKEDEVLIKVHSCGICGTDIHMFNGYSIGTHKPAIDRIFGHEFGGIITEVGSKVPDTLKKGMRVVIEPNIGCGVCKTCLAGNYIQCEQGQQIIGIHRNGGFAEYAAVPHQKVFDIPDSISFKAAAVLEPFAICVYGVKQLPILPGDTVLIMGTGVSGHHFIMLSKICGASKILVSGKNVSRLNLAEELGAEIINIDTCDLVEEVMKRTQNRGVDYVFECAGVEDTLSKMSKVAANKGKVCVYSVPVAPINGIDFSEYLFKDLVLVTASGAQNTFPRAIRIADSGLVDLEKVITHEYPMEEIQTALVDVEERRNGIGKAIVTINPSI